MEKKCKKCGLTEDKHYVVYGIYYYCDTKHTKEFEAEDEIVYDDGDVQLTKKEYDSGLKELKH